MNAQVAELVDAHGSGPCAARCGGSSPLLGTTAKEIDVNGRLFFCLKLSVHAGFRTFTVNAGQLRSTGIKCLVLVHLFVYCEFKSSIMLIPTNGGRDGLERRTDQGCQAQRQTIQTD